jgi:hypothetical protein
MVSSSPTTLTIWDKDGKQQDSPVPGPGGTARVCIGDRHGAHGSVWRIWANRNKSDLYIACRGIVGVQKWSLHESGDWRSQWVTSAYAQHLTNSDNRIIDQWTQPAELEDIGWTPAFAIRARLEDLVDYGDGDELREDIIWMPAPPQGHSANIHVIIARPDRLTAEVKGLYPFHAFSLADGRAVIVLFCLQPVTAEDTSQIEERLQAFGDHPVVQRASAPRATASVVDEEGGNRGVWDIAISKPARLEGKVSQRGS